MTVRITDRIQRKDKNTLEEHFYISVKILVGQQNQPPAISEEASLFIDLPTPPDANYLVPITSRVLTAFDEETDVMDLFYNVTLSLETAKIGHVTNADDISLSPISSFTQRDLADNKIAFCYAPSLFRDHPTEVPNGSYETLDRPQWVTPEAPREPITLNVQVTDEQGQSSPLSFITVKLRTPVVFSVGSRPGLILLEGQSVTIDRTNLNLSIGEDDAERCRLTMETQPLHGAFYRDVARITEFNYQDVLESRITYRHDDSDSDSDHIVLRITHPSEGNRANPTPPLLFPITVIPIDDEPPQITLMRELLVQEHRTVPVTAFDLSASDIDSDNNDIEYILTDLNNRLEGHFLKRYSSAPQNHDQNATLVRDVVTNQLYYQTVISSFKQADIINGVIFFEHVIPPLFVKDRLKTQPHMLSPKTLIVHFKLQDSASPIPNVSPEYAMSIRILPRDDQPPELLDGASLRVTVEDYQLKMITASELGYQDAYSSSKEVIIKVVKPPYDTYRKEQYGDVVLLDPRGIYLVVPQFTMKNVQDHQVFYRPEDQSKGESRGYCSRILRVEIDVEDAVGNVLKNESLYIILKPVPLPPPLIINSGLSVLVQGSMTLSLDSLNVVATGNKAHDDFYFKISQHPECGRLTVSGRIKNKFRLQDLQAGDVTYQHKVVSCVNDQIGLVAINNHHNIPFTLSIKVIALEKEMKDTGYDGDNNSVWSASFTVQEGGMVVISSKLLGDTDFQGRVFSVVKEPNFGMLFLNMDKAKTFKVDRIKKGDFRYVHTSGEIGVTHMIDTFSLRVTDDEVKGESAVTYEINFEVIVEPVDSEIPEVFIPGPLIVEEGGRIPLDVSTIHISDKDSDLESILCTLTSPPNFGFIEDVSPAVGFEAPQVGIAQSGFIYGNLMSQRMFYVQSVSESVEPRDDQMTITCSDGVNFSVPKKVDILILPVNDEPPEIFLKELVVMEGMDLIIESPILVAGDADQPSDILEFLILKKPFHGKIVSQETMDVIDRFVYPTSVIYCHDGSETTHDMFTLMLSDGEHNVTKSLHVKVIPVDDETPLLRINNGLKMSHGEAKVITQDDLMAEDRDSESYNITYILRQIPESGRVTYMTREPDGTDSQRVLSEGAQFTQEDINHHRISYVTQDGQSSLDVLRFDITDGSNVLFDQYFFINVLGQDRVYPEVSMKDISVKANERFVFTTDTLSTRDLNSEDYLLTYHVTSQPLRGHLESFDNPGKILETFTQLDLAGNKIFYLYTAQDATEDQFQFRVTDGHNSVYRTFRIQIENVDKKVIQLLEHNAVYVNEGESVIITPYEIKLEAANTDPSEIAFNITQAPIHGKFIVRNVQQSTFSQLDIDNNLVSYVHDGSETLHDTIVVKPLSEYSLDGQITDSPIVLKIIILPIDDHIPRLVKNRQATTLKHIAEANRLGFQFTNKSLLAEDSDSEQSTLKYIIVNPPNNGILVGEEDLHAPISYFTQDDVDNKRIYYSMNQDFTGTDDFFGFKIRDEGNNELLHQTFRINWAWLFFDQNLYRVNETETYLQVKIKKRGYLVKTSYVNIDVKRGNATPGEDYHRTYAEQVQFNPGQSMATWKIKIQDDTHFEGPETFQIHLTNPVHGNLLSNSSATVEIMDQEDESVIYIPDRKYEVVESVGELLIPLQRAGDLSQEMVVICYTEEGTARGTLDDEVLPYSDFISRPVNNGSIIRFSPGQDMNICKITILNDGLYEEDEKFSVLVKVYEGGSVRQDAARSEVTIASDINDVPIIRFGGKLFLVDESRKFVDVPIFREGSDLSVPSIVTVISRSMDKTSAEPGKDYVSVSETIRFAPGVTQQSVRVVILDDTNKPLIENNETFTLTLEMPQQTLLDFPRNAKIIIQDRESDIPSVKFEVNKINVEEDTEVTTINILRSGDISKSSLVRCFTAENTAKEGEDFLGRSNANSSVILFEPGDTIQPCIVLLNNDNIYEKSESFYVHLGTHETDVGTGEIQTDKVEITILDTSDEPTVGFEKDKEVVLEPETRDKYVQLELNVIRGGDLADQLQVEVFSLDGTATSDEDYEGIKQVLTFDPGVSLLQAKSRIMFDEVEEHREMFVVRLRLLSLTDVKLTRSKVDVYIQERSESTVITFHSTPIVVSLKDYIDGVLLDSNMSPSPGYAVMCVTSCDPRHPVYWKANFLCEEFDTENTEYRWRASNDEAIPLTDVVTETFFTNPNEVTLDTIYFHEGTKLQCGARPRSHTDVTGILLWSPVTTISNVGVCVRKNSLSLGSEPFTAKLKYIEEDSGQMANHMKISIKIPHQDGLIPLISSKRLSDFRSLVGKPQLYAAQHACSNVFDQDPHEVVEDSSAIRGNVSSLRSKETMRFYKHLDLDACLWTFEAYYSVGELLNVCGGSITTDGAVSGLKQSYISIIVPQYVSYLRYSHGSSDLWYHTDSHTQIKVSFVYDTSIMWERGIKVSNHSLDGQLYPAAMTIREDGHLVVAFKTEARFQGLFVAKHPESNFVSRITSEDHPQLSFSLKLIKTEANHLHTLQLWQFVSDYAVQDYSGYYQITLIPCLTEGPVLNASPECTPHSPVAFQLQVRLHQVSDPVPSEFSLDTKFRLMKKRELWMSDRPIPPESAAPFEPGDTIYGLITLGPKVIQEGEFEIKIGKCYLCMGVTGYIPRYQPDRGEYGCALNSSRLAERLKIIDTEEPASVVEEFRDHYFHAVLASQDSELSKANLNGSDGFHFLSDPLFQVKEGKEWFLHCIYVVKSSGSLKKDSSKRSASYADNLHLFHGAQLRSIRPRRETFEIEVIGENGHGTNMLRIPTYRQSEIVLDRVYSDQLDSIVRQKIDERSFDPDNDSLVTPFPVLPLSIVVMSTLLIIVGVITVFYLKKHQHSRAETKKTASPVGPYKATTVHVRGDFGTGEPTEV